MTDLEQTVLRLVRSFDSMIRAAIREELSLGERGKPPVPETVWLDEEALAAHLQISTATLQSWRYSGKGPPFTKIGRLVRYRATDVDGWIKKIGPVEPGVRVGRARSSRLRS